MKHDDHLCLCFHVTKRKVVNYLRVEKPSHPSQLSECFGAGTGCGWCRPFLKKLFEEAKRKNVLVRTPSKSTRFEEFSGESIEGVTPSQYSEMRRKYVKDGKGTPPPGAAT